MRRRLLALAVVAIAVVAFLFATRAPTLSPLEQTLAHWTPDRLTAWVALRPVVTAKPGGPAPTLAPPNVGQPRMASDAVSRASGRVFLDFFDDGACSGTVITDRSNVVSLVLTAAHCVYEIDRSRFASNWLFVPGLTLGEIPDCHVRPAGCWTPRALLVERAYAAAGSFGAEAITHDVGIAVFDAGPDHRQLDQTAGSLSLTSGPAADTTAELVGYPGDLQYSGSGLTVCSGPVEEERATNTGMVWAAACDMTGGSSGGAWVVNAAPGNPGIFSLTSSGIRSESRFGPVFDPTTTALIEAAETATENTVLAP